MTMTMTMTISRFSRMTMALVAGAALAAGAARVDAQISRGRAPGGNDATSPMHIALKVGTDSIAYSGAGTCQFTSAASIYDLPASLYTARYSDAAGSVSLTLWQPRSGAAPMMTLGITVNGTSHQVNTVKVGEQGTPQGSGTASITRSGSGGTFTLDATAAGGRRITGTIACTSFTEPIAEGGD